MNNVYTAIVHCVRIEPTGMPGYNKVCLGISLMNNDPPEIVLKGTYSRFQEGRQYIVQISEM